MWLPMEWPSEREANGLVMARGSNKLLEQMIANRSLTTGVGMRGQLNLLNMYKSIADSYPVSGPSLSVGDVLVSIHPHKVHFPGVIIYITGLLKVHSSQLLWQQQAEVTETRLATQTNIWAPGI